MGIEYVLKTPSDVIWHIYLDEHSRLVYNKMQSNKWSDAMLLDKCIIKNFSATVDINEQIHIVAYTSIKQLIYYQWNGSQWLYSIITTIRSRFQDIEFINILSELEHVHILYYIKSTLYKNMETLYHYYGNGFNWQGGKILSFPSEDNIDIISAYWYDINSLYLHYSYKKKNNTLIYRSIFDRKQYTWSNPIQVLKTDSILQDIQICIDEDKKIHMIGINTENNVYTLYYVDDENERIIINAQPKPFISPIIKYLKGNIYVAWAIDDRIFSIISTNMGNSFNKLKDVIANDILPFYHVTIKEDGYSQYEKSFGKIYPLFQSYENLVLEDTNSKSKSHQYSIGNELEEIEQEVKNLKEQINTFTTQFNDIYSLLDNFNEHFINYKKILYQLQSTIKKQSNEIQRLQQIITKNNYQTNVSYTIPYKEEDDTDEKEEKGEMEEILNVGNTKIIIRNEEDNNLKQ